MGISLSKQIGLEQRDPSRLLSGYTPCFGRDISRERFGLRKASFSTSLILAMSCEAIIIVGGGFTGAVAAAALADGTRHIVVLEAQNGSRPRFSGELIHPPGVDMLEELKLLPDLEAAGGLPVNGFVVSCTGHSNPANLPYAEIPRGRRHGLVMNCHRMVQVLQQSAKARPGVDWRENQRVTDVVREAGRVVGVRTERGQELRADVVLVAQGRQAPLRRTLGLDARSSLPSFSTATLLQNVALPEDGFAHIFLGAPGPLIAHAVGPGQVRLWADLPVDTAARTPLPERVLRDDAGPLPPVLAGARAAGSSGCRPAWLLPVLGALGGPGRGGTGPPRPAPAVSCSSRDWSRNPLRSYRSRVAPGRSASAVVAASKDSTSWTSTPWRPSISLTALAPAGPAF